MLKVGLTEAAGRAAYLAGFHAAQALISERTGRAVKAHKGVHTEFQRLTRDDQEFPSELRAFLSHAYNLKALADYETDPDAEVSVEQATQAIEQGRRFIAHLQSLLGESP